MTPKKKPHRDEKCPEGYFEFSTPLRKVQLEFWENDFKRKGIKTVIIRHGEKFILCREGEEAK